MIAQTFIELYTSKIENLKKEISLYPSDEAVWETAPGIINSGGTLCLHLIGNIKHFIGAVLGSSGYIRDRDKEFSERNVLRQKLIQELDEAILIINQTFHDKDDAYFMQEYPTQKFLQNKDINFALVFFLTHFDYHLGQVNYLRRITSV